MFRRLLAAVALIGATLAAVPAVANAAAGGGATAGMKTAMGRMATGYRHTCVVNGGGAVICWGNNTNGELGLGDTDNRTLGTVVPGVTATQVVASNSYSSYGSTCALLTDTGVKCWGDNMWGNLGNGTTTGSNSPVAVCAVGGCGNGLLTGVTELSMGAGFVCGILSDATVACWGHNNVYQLSTFTGAYHTTPVAIAGVTGATSIASGGSHTCAIVTSGALKCWGEDGYGQLGDGTTNKNTVVDVTSPRPTSGVKAIAGAADSTCAIGSDDYVYCWGSNNQGEMGFGADGENEASVPGKFVYDNTAHQTPHRVNTTGGDVSAKAITGGPLGYCAVTVSDTVVCWGAISGSSSHKSTNLDTVPYVSRTVSGVSPASAVSIGYGNACALVAGTYKCWGYGTSGALGNFGTGDSLLATVNAVIPIAQNISFGAIADRTTASAPFNVAATVDSAGGSVHFGTTTPGACSVTSAGLVTPLNAGTCTVTADADGFQMMQAPFDFYLSADTVSQSFTIANIAPLVSGITATSVTTTGAVLTATVNPARLNTTNEFSYGTSATLAGAVTAAGQSISVASDPTSDRTITSTLTGLSPGTTYRFRIAATNSSGTTTSPIASFTTLGAAPVVSTGSPTSVSSGRATLNGVVTPSEVNTSVWFTIGQKSDLSDGTRIEYRDISGSSATDISVTAANLVESTRYYFRVEASNVLGSARGDIKSFTAARPVGLSVNDADEFTNKKAVTLYATGPSGATQVIVSNDGGFKSSQTFTLTEGYAEIPWTLIASRDERLPKTVYARFVQRFGTQSANYSDDIILDTTAPVMTSASGASTSPGSDNVSVQGVRISASKGGVKLTVRAKDANSGIGTVQVKGSSGGSPVDVATGSPKASSRTIKVNTTKKKLWVRVVDRAGNVSKWVTVTVK